LDGNVTGSVARYTTTGVAPNRVLTVEWRGWQWNWFATGNTISFQCKLYETTNVVEFIYRQETGVVNIGTTGGASIGIAGATTGAGNYLSLNGTGASPAASSSTETTNLSAKPATGQIYRFTPPPAPTISGISPGSGCPGTSLTITGTNFTNASAVSIGGTAATSFSVTNSTTITAIVGAGATGTVQVTTPGGAATSPSTFTVNSAPAAPTASAATSITSTSATANWASVSGATSYRLDVSTSSAFATFVTGYNDLNVGSVTSASITGLTANTTYFYRVRGNNGSCSGVSSGTITFTTPCSAENAPTATQNFTTYTGPDAPNPLCWSEANGAVGNPSTLTGPSSDWRPSTGFANTGSNIGVKTNLYGTNSGKWIISNPINLGATAGLYRVSYNMAVTSYNGTTAQSDLGTHIVRVIVSTDGGTTWSSNNTIKTYTGAGTYSNTGQTETVNLTGYSGIVKIAFVATTSSTTPDIDFHLDDFKVELIPACAQTPSNLTASVTSSTTANVSWTAASPAPGSGYQYAVTTSTTPPASGTATTSTSASVSGLIANTTYYLHVRSNCNGTDFSNWVTSASFFTGYCAPTTTYTGYYISNVVTSNGETNLSNSTAALSAAGYGDFTSQSCSSYANGNITVSTTVYYGYGSIYTWIDWNNDFDFNDAGEQVLNSGSITSYTYPHTFSGSFTVPNGTTNGNYRMRIRYDYYSNNNPCGSILYGEVEDYTFTVVTAPPCASQPTSLTSSSITTTTATISWTAAATPPANGYEYYLSTTSTAPAAGTNATGSTGAGVISENLTSLASGTTYYFWVRSNCNGTDKSNWVSGGTFTTPCNPISSFPWTEGFEGLTSVSTTTFSNCWLEGTGTNWRSQDASTSAYNNPRTGSKYIGCVYSGTNDRIWTPGFQLTSGVSYDFSTYFVGDGYSGWTGDVVYNTTQSATGETAIGASFITSGTTSSSGTSYAQITRTFVAPASGVYYFGIRISSSYAPYSSMSFDDFSLALTPACAQTPSGLTAAATTSTTANVSWTAASPTPGSGYEYAVTTSTTPPASGTTTTSTSASVTGLSASTTYYLHVRSNCNGTDFSNWVTSTSFTTPCNAISSFPWTEGFEGLTSVSTTTFPNCWLEGTGTNWRSQNAGTTFYNDPRTGSYYVGCFYGGTNDRIWTPGFQLTSGVSYDFSTYFVGDGYSGWTGDVVYNTTQSATGETALGSSFITSGTTSTSGSSYAKIARTFVAPASGVYYFGIRISSSYAPYNAMSFDDFSLAVTPTVVPSCATYIAPANNESVVPSSGSVPVSWNAVTDADSYDIYKEGVFVANTTSTSYTLTGNTVGNSYSWYVVPKNVVGSAAGCSSSAISFSCVSVPSNDDPCDAIALSISNSLSYTIYSNAGSTGTTGPPTPSCGSYSTADVWFSLTVPPSGIITFNTQSGTMTDAAMAIYSGTCGSLTQILCSDDEGPGAMPYISLTGRTPGETLWIRMWEYSGDVVGTFGICVTSQAANLTSSTSNQNNVCPGTSVTLTANGVDGTAYWFTTCGTSGEIGTGNTLNVSPSSTTTYYARNYRYGNFSTNCVSVTVTVTQPSTNISVVNGVNIANGDYLWNGNTSPDGSDASNWYVFNGTIYTVATSAPTTQNVYIVSNTAATNCVSANSNPPSINPSAGTFAASNVYIGSDLTLTQANGSTFNVSGNFINNGTFTPGTGTVNMNGSTAQSIGGSAATTFNNLTINNASGVALENSANVDGTLTLTSGRLSLGSNNLTLGTAATISGTPSASNMIVAASTGELRKRFSSAVSNQPAFTFPVGTVAGGNEYTPVELDFISGSFNSQAYVGVRVVDQRSSVMNSGVTNYVNRNWLVEPYGITSPNYDITLHYVQNDWVGNAGAEGNVLPIKYSTSTGTGTWYQPESGGFTNAEPIGSGFGNSTSNFLNWQGVTSFSEFGGAEGNNQPLPVELVSFSGACEDGVINLTWQTASEFNSSHFDVEKSRDGENWQVLTTLPSAGTSNELITYQSTDQNGTDGNNYYRLRQVDIDGKEKLYDPINISCSEVTTGYFSSFPNPSGSSFQVIVNNKELIGTCTMNIVDAQGKVIEQREIDVKDGINMFVINQELTPGIYFLNITNGSKSTPVIRHAIK
jgi:hypothetical protein